MRKDRARSPSSSESSSSEDDREKEATVVADEKIWTEPEMNSLNAKIIKAEIMGQEVIVLV